MLRYSTNSKNYLGREDLLRFTAPSGGFAENAFVFTVDTSLTEAGSSNNDQYNLYLNATPGLLDITVQWGDGTENNITSDTDPNLLHTYPAEGIYQITILCNEILQRFQISNQPSRDRKKIISINNWGNSFELQKFAFQGCSNLAIIDAADALTLFENDCKNAFQNCTSLESITNSNWVISSNCTSLSSFFQNCSLLNCDINFDTSAPAAINLSTMFLNCTVFNGAVTNLVGSNVTQIASIFQNTDFFNQDLSSWNTSGIVNITDAFNNAKAFVGTGLTNWDVSNCTNFLRCFRSATLFNTQLNWDFTSATSLQQFMMGAANYNQTVENWNVSTITNMNDLWRSFGGNTVFDGTGLDSWNITSLTNANNFKTGAAGFTTTNYDALLVAWEAQAVQSGVNITFQNTTYTLLSAAATARVALIAAPNLWTITDGGGV